MLPFANTAEGTHGSCITLQDGGRFLVFCRYFRSRQGTVPCLHENSEDKWYLPMLFGKGKFSINGVPHHVYAVAFVYEGEVVFVGIQIGQAVY